MRFGTPISTNQAARAILRRIRSPIVGNVDVDSSPGYTLQRLNKPDLRPCLSRGEQRLVDIASSIYTGHGADIADIGGLDKDLRRYVLIVLFYLHLGDDLPIEWDHAEFADAFERRS